MQSRQMAARLPNLGGRFTLLHLNIARSCVEALNFANITLDLEPFSPDPKISLHWISFSPEFQLERPLGCSLGYIQSLKLNSLLDSNSFSLRPRWWLAFSGFKLNMALSPSRWLIWFFSRSCSCSCVSLGVSGRENGRNLRRPPEQKQINSKVVKQSQQQ